MSIKGDVTLPVSACVDCALPIIGERLRCPACHDEHARSFVFEDDDDADKIISVPPSTFKILLTWLVAAEAIAAVVAGCVLAVRGCG